MAIAPPSVAGGVLVAGGAVPLAGVVPLAPPLPVAGEVLPLPVVPEPVGALPEPVEPGELPEPLEEHEPVCAGTQTKSVPQSASALHGSCHLKAQLEVVVWVQVEGIGAVEGAASHFVFAGHATATAVPPLHAEMVSLWQTMSAPQSPSVVQGAGKQVMAIVPVSVVPAVTGVGQSAPFGQAGVDGGAVEV